MRAEAGISGELLPGRFHARQQESGTLFLEKQS